MMDFIYANWPVLLTILVVFGALQGTCGFLVYVERKVCAYMQDRIGPNRVGPFGLLQVLADGLKFLLKEDIIPAHVDKVLFILAPCIAITTAMLAFAVVPFGAAEMPPQAPLPINAFATPAEVETFNRDLATYNSEMTTYQGHYQFMIAKNVDIGILFIFAISSLAVYGIILGGWSANNKYSILGGLRSSAQIISYEIPLGLSILGIVMMTGSLNLERIIGEQADCGVWNIMYQPLAFVLFMTSAFAECNRLPFDLPECEQELVGGYHTEYNAMKLALFFIGEYCHMITTSFLMVILFFGGWHIPGLVTAESGWLIKLIVFAAKVTFFILFYMAIRWTLPRFRFDQLMGLAWKVMIPLALINLVAVMVVMHLKVSPWILLPVSLVVLVGAGTMAAAEPDYRKPSTTTD
ncbi:MAG: NADH-quinone oxidoreductase subunit NuoH [Gemmataceae bacterium]